MDQGTHSSHVTHTDARELLGQGKVIAGTDAPKGELRKKIVLCDDGRCFVAASHQNDADVQSFLAVRRRLGNLAKVILVPYSTIGSLQSLTDANAGVGHGHNQQATKLREILMAAAARSASDIHWVCEGRSVRIRFRVDSLLENYAEHDADYVVDLLRSAYNAHGSEGDNSTELQLSVDQDGRITSRQLLPAEVSSVRISSGPMAGGWEQVWRLTYTKTVAHGTLEELGYTPRQAETIEAATRNPHGMFIFGGPTGSGKSTTMQVVLTRLAAAAHGKINVYTIEEPVEMPIAGARQHSTATTTETDDDRLAAYVAANRCALRRDPDILMYGEIRDAETASLAVNVALRGRRVFTSLHGNTAIDLPIRLIHEGVNTMLVTDHTVFLIFASQSLVPRLCKHCALTAEQVRNSGHHEHRATDIERILTSFPEQGAIRFVGRGCDKCNNRGTTGRELVAEVMRTNQPILAAIARGDKASAVSAWLADGNQTKRMVAYSKAKRGLIDPLVAEIHVGELAVLDKRGSPTSLRKVLCYGYHVEELTPSASIEGSPHERH